LSEKKLFEYAIIKYLRDKDGGACITDIARHTGMGRPNAKELVFKLVKDDKIDVRLGQTEKKYHTWFFYDKSS
jgi:DNA-binding MarR family transcriptional regulator